MGSLTFYQLVREMLVRGKIKAVLDEHGIPDTPQVRKIISDWVKSSMRLQPSSAGYYYSLYGYKFDQVLDCYIGKGGGPGQIISKRNHTVLADYVFGRKVQVLTPP